MFDNDRGLLDILRCRNKGEIMKKKLLKIIELVIVVAVIGMLTNMALTQYQQTIMKSKYTALKNLTQSVAEAQEIYYLNNGLYATSFSLLKVQLPPRITEGKNAIDGSDKSYIFEGGMCNLSEDVDAFVQCHDTSIQLGYQIYLEHAPNNAGMMMCITEGNSKHSPQFKVCRKEIKEDVKLLFILVNLVF